MLPNRTSPVTIEVQPSPEPERSVEMKRAALEQMMHERALDEAPRRLDALEAQLAEVRARLDDLEGAK